MTPPAVERTGPYPDTHCVDCDTETVPWAGPIETYQVHDRLWKEAGMAPLGGRLCVGCIERRLGRRLVRSDFTRYSLRNAHMRESDRLRARQQGDGVSVGDAKLVSHPE